MFDFRAPASFQNIEEAFHVTTRVGMGIGQRIANTGLGRQMDDASKPMRNKEGVKAGSIFEIEFRKLKPWMRRELREAGFFEPDIVIGIQVIQPEHGISALQEPLAQMKSDKPCGARNEDEARCMSRHHADPGYVSRPTP